MCIETQSLATALLPQFASEIGYDVQLMRLLSAYQLNPGTETYNAVKNYLENKRLRQQQTLNTFNTGKRLDLNILDYENNLLWSTASLAKQDKIVLLYEASEYSQQATEGSAYQKFEDGSEYNLAWVSGGPLFTGGGAFKIGTTTAVATNTLTIAVSGSDLSVSTYVNSNNVSYNIYTFNENGTFYISGNVYDASGNEIDVSLNYVLVGGGGTGGNNGGEKGGGGGGGGGQVLLNSFLYTGISQNITVTIGLGGNGGGSVNKPSNGSNSTLSSPVIALVASGGLCGANGGDGYGGSNGGAVYSGGTYVAGGWYAGGGGGAGGDGLNGGGSDASDCTSSYISSYTSPGEYGNGGPGLQCSSVFFPADFYGGGGGSGQNIEASTCEGGYGEGGGGDGGWVDQYNDAYYGVTSGGAGNSGGGGGGACWWSGNATAYIIGSGGSGVCILSIKSSYLAT